MSEELKPEIQEALEKRALDLGYKVAQKRAAQKENPEGALDVTEYGADLLGFLGDDDPGDDEDAWLIQGVVAAGVPQMIAGHPKAKKTFLAEHQALCIAAGIDWLGRKTVRGRVLILPREDSVRETRRRIWRLARGLGINPRELDGWLRIDAVKPFYWADGEDVAAMRETIKTWKPSLIVIDSLSRTHMGDENSVKEMAVVCNTWSDICQQTGVAIQIIHHFTKSGQGSLLQQLRGSGNIGATLRHLVGVEKTDDRDGPFELSFDGNLQGLPVPFSVQMKDGTNDADPPQQVIRFTNAKSASKVPIDGDLVGTLMDDFLKLGRGDKLKIEDLRKGRGKAEAVTAAVEAMVDAGLIVATRRGRKADGYTITDTGREFAGERVSTIQRRPEGAAPLSWLPPKKHLNKKVQ